MHPFDYTPWMFPMRFMRDREEPKPRLRLAGEPRDTAQTVIKKRLRADYDVTLRLDTELYDQLNDTELELLAYHLEDHHMLIRMTPTADMARF